MHLPDGVNTAEQARLENRAAFVDPHKLAQEAKARAERILSTYEWMRGEQAGRRIDEGEVDKFFNANREVLVANGVKHYPPLSAAEQAIVDGWKDLQARNERDSVKQAYFNEHKDVIGRRMGETGGEV